MADDRPEIASSTPLAGSHPSPAPEDTRLGLLGGYLGFHLRLAQGASFRAFKNSTGRDDLKPGWYAVLSLVGDNPGIAPVALSRAAGRDKSTLTPVIRDLIKHGYLAKEPRRNDRRSYGLRLTRPGAARLAELAAHAAAHDRRLDEIAGPHKDELVRVLRRIGEELNGG